MASASAVFANWNDFLKPPDPNKKAAFQDKKFEQQKAPVNNAFPLNLYKGVKQVSSPQYPQQKYNSVPAKEAGKVIPDKRAHETNRSFTTKNWTGNQEFPTTMFPGGGRVSAFQDKKVTRPDLPTIAKELKPPPVLTEEQAKKLLNELYKDGVKVNLAPIEQER